MDGCVGAGRRRWRWRLLVGLRRGLLILLLLLKVRDALVLIGLRGRLRFPLPAECLPTAYAVPPTAAARSNGRRRLNMLVSFVVVLVLAGPTPVH